MGNLGLHTWSLKTYQGFRQRSREPAVLLALGVPLVAFVVLPLVLLLLNSFREVSIGEVEFRFSKLTLSNYITAYMNPKTWATLWNSLVFAVGSSAVAFLLGGLMAFFTERTDAPFRRLAYGLMLVPLIVPGMLQAIAWLLLLSPNIGLLNKVWLSIGFDTPLLNAYSMPVLCWVQGITMSPLSFLLLGASLRRMDPALEEAAITCGSSARKVITQVTAKLMLPAIMGVTLLNFVRALESLEAPLLLGLPGKIMVFSNNIWLALKGSSPPQYGLGFTYSLTLIVLTLLGILAYQGVMRQGEKYAVVTGKGYRPRIIQIGNWKTFAVGFQIFFAVVVVGLPLAVLVWASLLPAYQVPSMEMLSKVSVQNYFMVFDRPDTLRMLVNTAILAVTTSLGSMFYALLISWVVLRMKMKGGRVLDGLAFISYAIPGVSLGVAYLILFLSFPNPIYNTIWILVIAYIMRELPYGTRFTHAGLAQAHKELEEAGKVSGASLRIVFLHIVVPIMGPSLIGGGLYIFITAIKVYATAAILVSPQSMVLSAHIYQLWYEGYIGQAAALAVLMVAAISILTVLGGGRRMGQLAG